MQVTIPQGVFLDPKRFDLDGMAFFAVWFACCRRVVLVTLRNERMHCPHCGRPAEPIQG